MWYHKCVSSINDLIKRYDAAEQLGKSRIPNVAIAAFHLDTFASLGYPTRITQSAELWRYHDVMQDGRSGVYLDMLGTLLDHDADLVRSAASAIQSFSERRFGFASAGKDMLSVALFQFSAIRQTCASLPMPWTVLEIGPGCGYLGVLLGLAGCRYLALEASQAFYIYQNSLFADVFGTEYNSGLDKAGSARIQHIPWWEFCQKDFHIPKLTCGTSNHMLSEMNRDGLRWTFSKLYNTQENGFPVVAESLGRNHVHSMQSTLSIIAELGFDGVKTEKRYWQFTKTSGRSNMSFDPQRIGFLRKAQIKVRALAESLYSQSGLKDHIKKPLPPKDNVLPPKDSVIRRVLAEFPDYECADHQFRSGRW